MLRKRIKFLFSREALKELLSNSLMMLGVLWLILEIISFFFPVEVNKLKESYWIFFSFVGATFVGALVFSFPPLRYTRKSSASNVEVELKVGNLLNQTGNIAIGSSDCFDTEFPQVIPVESLKAQLIQKYFQANHTLLDQAIDASLRAQGIVGPVDSSKIFGKKHRYPVGTVATVPAGNKQAFITVYSKMNADKLTLTSIEDIWLSLCGLWSAVRLHGNLHSISIPIWGAGLARAKASRLSLIQLVLISFAIATREIRVSRKLSIIIYEPDYEPDEMRKAIRVLNSIDF